MKKFSGHLIISDLDGTLVCKSGIGEKNKEAIRCFTENGGAFTIATGRSVEHAQNIVDELEIKIPTIHINGACIYDNTDKKYLYAKELPDSFRDISKDVAKAFPNIGIMAWAEKGGYIFAENEFTKAINGHGKLKIQYTVCSVDETDFNPHKLLFVSRDGDLDKVEDFIRLNFSSDADYVFTGSDCLEMIPKGVSKGNALKKLAEIMKIDRMNIAAAGDYLNDIEMIEYAGIGAAVENALDEVKAAADVVLCRCEDNAIADLIGRLDRQLA